MNKPEIVAVLTKEGIELKKKGKYYWAPCPFHKEKNPSFMVNPERQTFHCFGCHQHGDVVSFIRSFRGLSFKDTLTRLGISDKRNQKKNCHDLRRRDLIAAFRQWCDHYYDDLCSLYRTLQKAKSKVATDNDVIAIANFYHEESIWLNRMEILLGNDDKEKFELYKEWPYGKL